MNRITALAITCALFALAAPSLQADTLDMSETGNYQNDAAPQRGMSMQRVESKWGQPTRRMSAVGQPPITRWQYDGFVVYFEFDKVIHTVATRS